MECNKDEATRAKSIAEGKLEQNDFSGAKKFALKAQSLFPGLDGISQLVTTLQVYVSAQIKISGEVDWYGVLGVDPSADDETIKKQYKKLALMVHPDKNSCIGADGAFKLISGAWRFLSDKAKRLEYNKRRGYKGFQQNVQADTGRPSAPSKPSQPNASTYTGGPSAPPKPSQQKVPRHTGGPSALSRSSPAHSGVPSAPPGPSQHKSAGPSAPSNSASKETSAPKPQKRSAKASRKQTHSPTQNTQDTFWSTGGPPAPPRPSEQKVPSAPSRPSQQKIPRHTGGPSAPSRPSQHKGPGPSAPSDCASTSTPKPLDRSAKASRKRTPGPSQQTINAFWTTGGSSTPSRPSQQNVPRHTGGQSAPSRSNHHKDPGPSASSKSATRKTSAPKPHDTSAKVSKKRTPVPSQQTIGTFKTTCHQCTAQHEYLKIFLNCTLLCNKCKKPFKASESSPA